jgi:hypothetical protein
VKSICSRALWLKDGEIAGWGAAKDVAREYEKFCWREQGIPIDEDGEPEGGSVQQAILGDLGEKQAAQPATAPADKIQQALLQQADDFAQRAEDAGRIGTGVVQFASVVLTDTEQRLIQRVSFAQEAVWEALIVATQDISSDVVLGVAIFNVKGERIAGVQNVHHNLRLDLKAGQSIRASVRMGFPFTHEKYAARFTLLGYQNGERLVNEVYDFNRSIILDQVTDAVFFEVELHRDFPIGPAVCLPSEITLGESR